MALVVRDGSLRTLPFVPGALLGRTAERVAGEEEGDGLRLDMRKASAAIKLQPSRTPQHDQHPVRQDGHNAVYGTEKLTEMRLCWRSGVKRWRTVPPRRLDAGHRQSYTSPERFAARATGSAALHRANLVSGSASASKQIDNSRQQSRASVATSNE